MTRPEDIPAEIWEQADILKDELRQYKDDLEYTARLIMWLKQQDRAAGLTQPQSTVLSFTKAFISERGFSPNYDEIAVGTGLRHKGRVCVIIDQLEERGLVRRLPRRARSISIIQHNNVSAAHTITGVN